MWEKEIDERAFKAWFWRYELKRYRKSFPDAKKLPENYGASKERIDDARAAYIAGFKRRDNLWKQ